MIISARVAEKNGTGGVWWMDFGLREERFWERLRLNWELGTDSGIPFPLNNYRETIYEKEYPQFYSLTRDRRKNFGSLYWEFSKGVS